MATLTYVYADSTVVLGPLAIYAEPHSYDLCVEHAENLTVPRGWELMRLEIPAGQQTPDSDDLVALADAVREAAKAPAPEPQRQRLTPDSFPADQGTRRGHLRSLPDS